MNQKGFANIVLIIIVVAIVVVGGYFSFVKNSEPTVQQQIPSSGEKKNPTKTSISTTTPKNEMADWITYTDSKYGFEFKYPPGHELDKFDLPIQVSGGTVYGGEYSITFGIKDKTFWDMDYNDKLSFAVKFRPKGEIFTPEEYLKNAFPTHSNDAESMHSYPKGIANGRLQKTTFAGHRAIVESPSYLAAGYKTIYLYGSEDNYFILISQGTDAKVLSQILSTFKFSN